MFELESFLVFIFLIAVLIYRDRRNVKIEGIVLMRRTQKGKSFIERIASRHKRLWNAFFTIAVVVSFPVMLFTFWLMASNAVGIVQRSVNVAPVSLVVPGAVGSVEQAPGLLVLPWWLWVIGIFSVMIPHEFSHGIASRISGIRIKSLGWLLLLFLPGAFCEPDEKQLKKAGWKTKMKVYAAGSFANMIFALPFLLISVLIFSVLFYDPCLAYTSNIEGYPMALSGASSCIFSVNGVSTTTPEEMSAVLSAIQPGSSAIVMTMNGTYNITTVARPDGVNGSFIGISGPYYSMHPMIYEAFLPIAGPLVLIGFVSTWIFFLNMGIGMINLLPIKPLDGGLIMEEVIVKLTKNKKKANKLVIAISLLTFGILVFDIIGPYAIGALGI